MVDRERERERARERPNDVVVLGATGFTGRLACEYLARHAPEGTRWAIAGRDERKLFALRERLGELRVPPAEARIADVGDPLALRAIARDARVLITTVGPYARYGMPVLEAAVDARCDYVDITGEPDFVRTSIDRFDAVARERGLRVVHCCGFDSVPHDLGALFTAQLLPHDAAMTIEAYVRTRSTFSGGTWQTAIQGMARLREIGATTRRAGPEHAARTSAARRVRALPRRVRWSPQVGAWGVPLPTIDPEIVLRSARALDAFGPDFRYGHYARVRTLRTVALGVAGIGAVAALAQVGPTRRLLERVRPSGEGPSAEQRARAWFEVTFVGEAASRRVVTTVSGGDPGYDETAKMVSESALCLAHDRARLPERAGVLTTAVAMGDLLRERLQRAGMRFQIKERV